MKKRIVTYGALAIFLCGTLMYVWVHPGVSILGYARIHPGMHATEVESLLDGSGRGAPWRWGNQGQIPNPGWDECWPGPWGDITLQYNADGRVVETEWNWTARCVADFLEVIGWHQRVRE